MSKTKILSVLLSIIESKFSSNASSMSFSKFMLIKTNPDIKRKQIKLNFKTLADCNTCLMKLQIIFLHDARARHSNFKQTSLKKLSRCLSGPVVIGLQKQ